MYNIEKCKKWISITGFSFLIYGIYVILLAFCKFEWNQELKNIEYILIFLLSVWLMFSAGVTLYYAPNQE